MTGRRPKRSDTTPRTGEKKNCIAANTVPKMPFQSAATFMLPPRKSRISFGSTGKAARAFPMPPKLIQCVVHRLRFARAHATTTHGIVKHAIALFPGARVLIVGNIVEHGGIPIFSLKRTTHQRPKCARDGGPI